MKLSKTTFWNLFLLFEIILVIKIIPVFLTNGPYIIPDESCTILRATHFIENFEIKPCKEITLVGGGDTSILYSIIISPIFFFLYGIKAFHATQILNGLLISSLVFPLFKIIKKFISNDKIGYILTTILLFLPQVTVFEKTLMTESLFFFLIVWVIYFYLNSFNSPQKKRNKSLTILLSILAALARPFGFITIIAITINEITISKTKKKILPFLIPLSLIITLIVLYGIIPNSTSIISDKIQSLSEINNWKLIFKALVNQLNSFTIATYLIPIIIFFNYLYKEDSKDIKNIRWFLLSYIGLNFIISAQHIYGYYLEGNDPNLLTRYIQSSILIIFLFAGIFFVRHKKFTLNKNGIIIFSIMIGSLFLFKDEGVKLIQNLDLAIYHNTGTKLFGKDIVTPKDLITTFVLPISLVLSILLIKNARKAFATIFIIILISTSSLSILWATTFVSKEPITQFLIQNKQDKRVEISFIYNNSKPVTLTEMWLMFALTKDKLNLITVDKESNEGEISAELFGETESFYNADYIISKYNIPELPLITTNAIDNKLYKNTYKSE